MLFWSLATAINLLSCSDPYSLSTQEYVCLNYKWECIERHSNDLHATLEHPQYLKSAPSNIQMLDNF